MIRSRAINRRPVHARLGKLTTGERLPGSSRVHQVTQLSFSVRILFWFPVGIFFVIQVPFVRDDCRERVIDEDEMSADDEDYSDGDMWDEADGQFDDDEYMEEVRPSVYNRLSC